MTLAQRDNDDMTAFINMLLVLIYCGYGHCLTQNWFYLLQYMSNRFDKI